MNHRKITVEICMGTTCFVLGANEFSTIDEQVSQRWPGLVDIRPVHCLGDCRGGAFHGAPYMKVNDVPVGKAHPQMLMSMLEEMLGGR